MWSGSSCTQATLQQLNLQYLHVVKRDRAGGRCSDSQLVLLFPHVKPLCVAIHYEACNSSVSLGGIRNNQKLFFILISLKIYYLHSERQQTWHLHTQLCNFLLDILYYRIIFSFPFCFLTTGTWQLSQEGWKSIRLWVLLLRTPPGLSSSSKQSWPWHFYFPWLEEFIKELTKFSSFVGRYF